MIFSPSRAHPEFHTPSYYDVCEPSCLPQEHLFFLTLFSFVNPSISLFWPAALAPSFPQSNHEGRSSPEAPFVPPMLGSLKDPPFPISYLNVLRFARANPEPFFQPLDWFSQRLFPFGYRNPFFCHKTPLGVLLSLCFMIVESPLFSSFSPRSLFFFVDGSGFRSIPLVFCSPVCFEISAFPFSPFVR